MARLLAERAALETRMASLTGADANAARYPVTPMAERRADHRRWEDSRQAEREALLRSRATRDSTPRDPRTAPPRAIETPPPNPGGTPVDPRRWYARRDAELAKSTPKPSARAPVATTKPRPEPRQITKAAPKIDRPPADRPADRPVATRPAAVAPPEKRSKPAVKPVARVKPVTRVTKADRPPERSFDRPAKREEPLRPRAAARKATEERPVERQPAPRETPRATAPREPARPFGSDLRRAVTSGLDRALDKNRLEKIGADRIAKPKEKIQRPLADARRALDGANRATRTLSDAWDKRRDRIAGPDLTRYTQGYDARKAKLLGVETGSLNDMAERSERQRQAGIARRAEARRAETADENRRARAQEKRAEQLKADRR
jgi:hypothetical protein